MWNNSSFSFYIRCTVLIYMCATVDIRHLTFQNIGFTKIKLNTPTALQHLFMFVFNKVVNSSTLNVPACCKSLCY